MQTSHHAVWGPPSLLEKYDFANAQAEITSGIYAAPEIVRQAVSVTNSLEKVRADNKCHRRRNPCCCRGHDKPAIDERFE